MSLGLILSGVALLALAGGYYSYAKIAEAQLAHLAVRQVASSNETAVTPGAQEQSQSPVSLREVAPLPLPTDPLAGRDGLVVQQLPQAHSPLPEPNARQASQLWSDYLSSSDTTRISIPSIAVESRVVELGVVREDGQWVWQTPDHAVGHHKGTASSGEVGNVVMSGHISSPLKGEGNVFKDLPKIELGSLITITTPKGEFTYRVTEKKVVEPTATWVMDPTPYPILTLITCVPDWVYTHRLVVTALPARSVSAEPLRE